MKMKIDSINLLILFLVFSVNLNAQQMFQNFEGDNIGNPKLKGDFVFNKKDQSFTVEGAGYNIWFERDEFYFVSQEAEGDFIFSARPAFVGEGVDPHRKMGLMIRNSKEEDAVYMDAAIHGDGLTSLQFRNKPGGETQEITSEMSAPDFIQIERKGKEYIFRASKNGVPLVEVGRVVLAMSPSVRVGMFVSSHNEEVKEKAKFWNVRFEKPAAEDVDGYQSPSPGRLEIIDIGSGIREVIYETETHIEAPNWSRNGKFLVYNSGGKLYKFDLKKRTPELINTGDVTDNNNDHGISFDGKTLAISSSTEDNGQHHSIIYTVPVEGGTPFRVTPNGPSYWHGWSPDDKWLTYCAERGGNYDVYKIPVNGGEEIRLTTAEGLDDGPEYSPDGKYIYFNSVRSGTMEIWRMKPDGSDKEQVTDDAFQNWFAHPSPDGNWLIMISYPPEVPAGSHPHNKRVMLRLMPVNGGEIKTVAFLYGGQGTLNVPSWSPDSKKVAFVSFTY
ncbi:WD40-like Beta Propeller Repeat [Tangfeifania diversioriginum]|uniref:WD40-like Beta Propeller Repeat n=2 Tax=Tangfeifania diversioriginum TaxID=1168035 RepID=A0A1M6I0Y4_9BACT|nr:WD40-like Beta Propeller Repeat [Tangfeifania diversioriginum]